MKRNKKFALLMVFVMMATMFIGIGKGSASESTDYTVYQMQNVKTISEIINQPKIKVTIDDLAGIKEDSIFNIGLPTGLTYNTTGEGTTNDNTFDICIVVPDKLSSGQTNNLTTAMVDPFKTADVEVNIKFSNLASGEGQFWIYFNNVKVNDSFDGDIKVTLIAAASSGFTTSQEVIAKYNGTNNATVVSQISSIKSFAGEELTLDNIVLLETAPGTFNTGDVVKYKLPEGFKWIDKTGLIGGNWSWKGVLINNWSEDELWLSEDDRQLNISVPAACTGNTTEGYWALVGFAIEVSDDSMAKEGSVMVNVSSDSVNVTNQDIIIATYGKYDVSIESKTVADVLNGFNQQELGSFYIKESLKGSLPQGRSITLTLPEGVKWNTQGGTSWPETGKSDVVKINLEKGDLAFVDSNPSATTNDGRTIKFAVKKTANGSDYVKSWLLFSKPQVTIAPNFSGDLTITVGGSVKGEVKVAKVIPRATLSSDGKAKIKLGIQDQKISDFTIKESLKGAFKAKVRNNALVLALPNGAIWSKVPTVTVTDGDLSIADYNVNDEVLKITLGGTSSIPSTITVSDGYVTIDRTIPDGDLKVELKGADGTSTSNELISSAITDNAYRNEFGVSAISEVVVGNVALANQEVVNQSVYSVFTIGSTSYTLNGAVQTMEVAPYIKDGRTFMPIRYVANAMGIADANILWNAANQTVTMMKENKVLQLKIGSKVMLVNGAAVDLDVAPEISRDRTCLPVALVAQAYGASANWDAATKEVTVKD